MGKNKTKGGGVYFMVPEGFKERLARFCEDTGWSKSEALRVAFDVFSRTVDAGRNGKKVVGPRLAEKMKDGTFLEMGPSDGSIRFHPGLLLHWLILDRLALQSAAKDAGAKIPQLAMMADGFAPVTECAFQEARAREWVEFFEGRE